MGEPIQQFDQIVDALDNATDPEIDSLFNLLELADKHYNNREYGPTCQLIGALLTGLYIRHKEIQQRVPHE